MPNEKSKWRNPRMWPLWAKVALACGLLIGGLLAVPPDWLQTYQAVNGGNGGNGTTAVFEALAYDGHIQNATDAGYGVARNATTGSVSDNKTALTVGQRYWSLAKYYYVFRGFLYFDTSSLPDDAVIESWILSVNITGDSSGTEFNLTIQNGQPTYPHAPLESGDYDLNHYSGEAATLDTATITTTGIYYNFTAATVDWINKTGTTKLCIRSSRDINNQAPTGNEYVSIGAKMRTAAEEGYPAKLYVTYTVAEKICWVWKYDSTEQDSWGLTGDTPYLNNNTANYITSGGIGNISWFYFQNTTLTSNPQRVFLMIEWRTTSHKPEEINLYIHNGVSEYDLGNYSLPYDFNWQKINITNYVSTVSQVNNSKIKIRCLQTGVSLVIVRRAYLRLYYGPEPLKISIPILGKAKSDVTIAAKWHDPDGLSSYAFNHNASGAWLTSNITGTLSGTTDWSNVTITMPSDTRKVVAYRFWVSDSLGNWEESFVYYVYTVWSGYDPNKLVSVFEGNLQQFMFPPERRDFYANGLYWKFYANTTHILYAYSSDGENWNFGGAVTSVGEARFFVNNFQLNGTDYIEYTKGVSTNDDLVYRRGILHSNGTIQWLTGEQLIQKAPGTGNRYLAWGYGAGTRVNSQGYPFIVYEYNRPFAADTDCQAWVGKSAYNNGTWANDTALGFPINYYEKTGYGEHIAQGIFNLPNDDFYLMFCASISDNQDKIKGMILNWTGSVYQLEVIEDVSAHNMTFYAYWTAVADSSGNIYVVYRTQDIFYFSYRNYTSGSWTIRGQQVTTYLTKGEGSYTAYSYPILSLDEENNQLYLLWMTKEDNSLWVKTYNITSGIWRARFRALTMPVNQTIIGMPQTTSEFVHAGQIICNIITYHSWWGSVNDGTIWAYLFSDISTYLSTGWNNLTVTINEVGKTLGQINASLNYDSINWTYLVLEYPNGTQYTFVYGYTIYANVTVTSVSDRLYIYCNAPGTWTHTYP